MTEIGHCQKIALGFGKLCNILIIKSSIIVTVMQDKCSDCNLLSKLLLHPNINALFVWPFDSCQHF